MLEYLRVTSSPIGRNWLVSPNGELYMVGPNGYGQLGLGQRKHDRHVFTRVELPEPVREVSTSQSHSCVLTRSGRVYMSGDNSSGQLGLGHTSSTSIFTLVPTGSLEVIMISAGQDVTYLLTQNNELWVTGRHRYNSTRFVRYLSGIAWIRCFEEIVYYVTQSNELYYNGQYNQFQSIDVDTSGLYVDVSSSLLLPSAVLLTSRGTIYTQGNNASGQLALGDDEDRYDFTRVPFGPVSRISMGNTFLYVISRGRLYFSGATGYGSFRSMDGEDARSELTYLPSPDRIVAVACESDHMTSHTYVLTAHHLLYSCGLNYRGILGLGDTEDRNVFTPVNP